MTDDEGQIRDLLANMAAGYRARDAERIVAGYAPDMMVFNLAPPLRTGAGERSDIGGGLLVDMATADGVRVWLARFGDQPFEYEVVDLAVFVGGGDVAFAHALGRMGSPGGLSLWFRFTVGLRKRAGTWQIAHLHASVPFYLDETRRAALDLTP
jgi:ketosteroid isomerase-like protein